MTASVPSRMARHVACFSAGWTWVLIMESSIWVAVITTLRARTHFSIIIFCAKITSSTGISTPVATRNHDTVRRFEDFVEVIQAFRFSILEMIWIFSPPCAFRCSRISTTSERLRMKEAATKSTPCSQPKIRSCLSFSASAGSAMETPGRLTPLFSPGRRCSALYR